MTLQKSRSKVTTLLGKKESHMTEDERTNGHLRREGAVGEEGEQALPQRVVHRELEGGDQDHYPSSCFHNALHLLEMWSPHRVHIYLDAEASFKIEK